MNITFLTDASWRVIKKELDKTSKKISSLINEQEIIIRRIKEDSKAYAKIIQEIDVLMSYKKGILEGILR